MKEINNRTVSTKKALINTKSIITSKYSIHNFKIKISDDKIFIAYSDTHKIILCLIVVIAWNMVTETNMITN